MSTGAVGDPVASPAIPGVLTPRDWLDPPSTRDPVGHRRWTLDEVRRMDQGGVLAQVGPVELHDGILFPVGGRTGPLRFTRAQYHRLGEAGVLRPDERVELIRGSIYVMSPIGTRHVGTLDCIADALRAALQGRAHVRTQSPIALPDESEPEPDLVVVPSRADYYRSEHPRAKDAWLLVEVMDSSRAYDRGVKLPEYAAAGVPETWLADIRAERFEVHRRPLDGVYTESFTRQRGQTISIEAFPDIVLDISQILG